MMVVSSNDVSIRCSTISLGESYLRSLYKQAKLGQDIFIGIMNYLERVKTNNNNYRIIPPILWGKAQPQLISVKEKQSFQKTL